ncbi:hypothetical protein [Microbacterium sp. Root180]|uniref:hypothetical protein n=1 Tax=Microbacterium sp. Root180 TaxID=1736483 RepID=UPI000A795CC5|nr:hypothetical protein [Microbacterium sp. Root180]
MKKRRAPRPISDDEHMARYAYVLGNVPASVADKAFAAAFAQLSEAQRRVVLDELRPHLPAQTEAETDIDPDSFAVNMRDLHWRSALARIESAPLIAAEFVRSRPTVDYFRVGAGSVTMDHQPPWVHELAGHETAPLDGGRMHHRQGMNQGEWYV